VRVNFGLLLKYGLPALGAAGLTLAILVVQAMRPEHVQADPVVPPPASAFPQQLAGVGMVETASEDIAIGVPVTALVAEVYVRPGDRVRQGQPLLRLDDRDLRAELALREAGVQLAAARLERLRQAPRAEEIPPAEARLAQARAELADAESQLRRIEAVTDRRAVRAEDLERRKWAVEAARARVQEAEATLALLRAGAWQQDIRVAEAELEQARRQRDRLVAELDRFTVRAPVSGIILRVKVRPGELAVAAPSPEPLILMGAAPPYYVRVDVDEKDSVRLRPGARAVASIRGDARRRFPLRFVRIEPYVTPKRNLTGETTERTDTRVLQILYALAADAPVYPGQQMDVFIEVQEERP
jgi:multidrug resistance efflux pump